MISTSNTTPPAPGSKTAEFARLFDLFERLASRKTRAQAHDATLMEDIRSLPHVPADLAPVVNSLAGLISTRKHQDDDRMRREGKQQQNKDDDDDDAAESLAKFPLGKRYPFTFRMMLHKLYQLDDWARKVKEVLERSQIEYKPLAETAMEAEKGCDQAQGLGGQTATVQDGRVHFKAGIASGSRKPGATRPRSHTIAVTVGGRARDAGALKSPRLSPTMASAEETRAVKKRCVGRRKSMNGPLAAQAGMIGGNWVYDAAVSAAEPTGRCDTPERMTAPPVGCLGDGMRSVRGTRRVSLGAPGMRSQVQPIGAGESGLAARRRALSVLGHLGPMEKQGNQIA